MTYAFVQALACLMIGALTERLRGGWPPIGKPGSDNGAGTARLVRSLLLSALVYAVGAPLLVAAACFLTLWLGICIGSHKHCWRVECPEQLIDMLILGMTRGVFGLAPLFCWAGLERGIMLPAMLLLALPAAHAFSYQLASRLDPRLPRWGGILDDWNAYAELLWGAYLGAAIILLVRGG